MDIERLSGFRVGFVGISEDYAEYEGIKKDIRYLIGHW